MSRVITLAGLALSACSASPIAPADHNDQREHVAGYMVRLGYDRLVAACAFEIGKRGGTRAEAVQKCLADFKFEDTSHDHT